MVAEFLCLIDGCVFSKVSDTTGRNLVVNAPADVFVISLAPVAPPGVGFAGGVRMQVAVYIDHATAAG